MTLASGSEPLSYERAEPAAPSPDLGRIACRTGWRAGLLMHSGVSVQGFYLMHALGACVPMVAGIALYGWRAALTTLGVVLSAAIALVCWRNIGIRGRNIQPAQALWMAMLLGLMLPAHLASSTPPPPSPSPNLIFTEPPWPILAAGGFLVVMLLWLGGGSGYGRFHPSPYALLILVGCIGPMLAPHGVLARAKMGKGDILRSSDPPPLLNPDPEPWLSRTPVEGRDAFWIRPAAEWLSLYTRGALPLERGRMPLHELLRERMPPMEDLVVAGQPAGVGCASAVAVIIGGLFLLYRGVIDFRIPLLIIVTAYAAFLILPVPTVITEKGAYFRWVLPWQPDVLWEQAITFANYELTASPVLFMAFFVATAPILRPFGKRARCVYASLVGVATAAAQLYVSVYIGPYLALVLIGLVAPNLDRWFTPRTLV